MHGTKVAVRGITRGMQKLERKNSELNTGNQRGCPMILARFFQEK